MIFLQILKVVFQLAWFIVITVIKWILILLGFLFVLAISLPDSSIELDYNEKSTNPFSDSLFHKIEEQWNMTSEREYTESNKLKIIKDCIAQVPVSSYTRFWRDDSNNEYQEIFEIKNGIVCESSYNRNQLYVEYIEQQSYWRNVYSQIVKFDTTQMQFIYEKFEKVRREKELDYAEFANMVVAFVQSIPYTLILSTSKEEAQSSGGFLQDYIENKKGPVVENIKFGFFTPLEFLHSIRGDCDTRTLTVYSILSHFGYDVVILNCSVHSMIGINIPSQGKALKYKGKKYYFWETTNTGWQPGQLPAEYDSYTDWYIALPSVNDF
ncbi:MAG: hypothetical protein KatS3mg035_0481 [Bacteroidia bacterium]|nr:MAG: hypothetical protein KatS3mg035_0481 [Bacteroidia bacterium]